MTLLKTRCTYAQNDNNPTEQRTIIHTRGVPQGGILSPLMWNLAFDSFLEEMKNSPEVRTVAGYTDDVCLLIQGS
jgi:hypothetical protein